MVYAQVLAPHVLAAAQPMDEEPELGAIGKETSTYSTSSVVVPPLGMKPADIMTRWADYEEHSDEEERQPSSEMSFQHNVDSARTHPHDAASQQAVSQPVTARAHVSYEYRYNPYYGDEIVDRLFTCGCEACSPAVSPSHAPAHEASGEAHGPNDGMGIAEYGVAAMDEYVASTQEYMEQLPPVNRMNFVLPAPPPLKLRGVIDEEGCCDGHRAIVGVHMRWYTRVLEVQAQWLPESKHCPAPAVMPGFDQWVEACGKWWVRHFGEAQKRTHQVPSQPAGARRSGAASFQTHARR